MSEGLHSNVNSDSASVSGAVEWADWTSRGRPLRVDLAGGASVEMGAGWLRRAMGLGKRDRPLMPADRAIAREMAEELGLGPAQVRSIELVGIAREFRRLGKPEFFYLVRCDINAAPAAEWSLATSTYAWEYGGRLRDARAIGPVPHPRDQQRFFFSNLVADPRFNEITRLAFYFLVRRACGPRGTAL